MAFTFPSSPSEGDTFEHAGFQYQWRTSPDRWAGNGFSGAVDPLANFVLTDFTGAGYDSGNISQFDQAPFNAGGLRESGTPAIGDGIAADSTATNGVISLWQEANGQGSAILFPTNLVGSTGILAQFVTEIDASTQGKATLTDGTVTTFQISSTFTAGSGSFGPGGPLVSGSQVMEGGASLTTGTGDNADIAELEFRIAASGTGVEGNGVRLIIDRDNPVSTVTDNADGDSSIRYNYRYGETNAAFVAA